MTIPNEEKLGELAGKVIEDISGATSLLMAYLGDQAGLYNVMDNQGSMSASEIASKSGLNPRYVLEWLNANAAAGYVDYDAAADTFRLTPEQATVFGREGQPVCMQGFFQAVISQFETHEQAAETFKSGKGRPWSDQSPCCFCATDRFFKPGYSAHLINDWIPSLNGVHEKLTSGGKVADIACGHGSSSILMAQAFPKSHVVGIDFHEPSIEAARQKARDSGIENVEFVVATAQDFAGDNFDFACIFDALHDMGDPVGATRHIRNRLNTNGVFMLVEPMAGDTLADNLNPIGQIFYSLSTTACLPSSLAQPVGYGLGAQAGEKRLTDVLKQGGFEHVRRATETPTNMVLEARV